MHLCGDSREAPSPPSRRRRDVPEGPLRRIQHAENEDIKNEEIHLQVSPSSFYIICDVFVSIHYVFAASENEVQRDVKQ